MYKRYAIYYCKDDKWFQVDVISENPDDALELVKELRNTEKIFVYGSAKLSGSFICSPDVELDNII